MEMCVVCSEIPSLGSEYFGAFDFLVNFIESTFQLSGFPFDNSYVFICK
eukprot:COSAG02_NODE_419_length_22613_cov_22.994492_9_plen_49_part_00